MLCADAEGVRMKRFSIYRHSGSCEMKLVLFSQDSVALNPIFFMMSNEASLTLPKGYVKVVGV